MPEANEYGSVGLLTGSIWLPSEAPLQDDDAVWVLYEEERFVDNNKTLRRFQVIQVVRDHNLVEFDLDMGLAEDFAAQPFMIFAAGEDKAADVLDMATKMRLDKGLELAMSEHAADFDLYGALLEQGEQLQVFARRNPRTTRRLRREEK